MYPKPCDLEKKECTRRNKSMISKKKHNRSKDGWYLLASALGFRTDSSAIPQKRTRKRKERVYHAQAQFSKVVKCNFLSIFEIYAQILMPSQGNKHKSSQRGEELVKQREP